jgi:tetratricopeptide (TPR) repeat protein
MKIVVYCKDNEVVNTLKEVTQKGSARAMDNGYLWLKNIFLPCIDYAENNLKDKKELLAGSFYVLGDIYDFIDAPKSAINAYKQSIKYDSGSSGAYREIALCYEAMGDYERALKYNNIAREQDPEDKYALKDREYLEQTLRDHSSPLFMAGSKVWQCDEFLAVQKVKQALTCLGELEDALHSRARARCFGSVSNCGAYLKEWERITKQEESFELSYSDWFYMPEEVFDSPEIWRLLFSIQNRIIPSVFVSLDSMVDCKGIGHLEQKEIQSLMISFNLYRTDKNVDGLRELKNNYPGLPEIQEELNRLDT